LKKLGRPPQSAKNFGNNIVYTAIVGWVERSAKRERNPSIRDANVPGVFEFHVLTALV
jgi:hypothetical protein